MKKLLYLIVLMLVLGLIVTGCDILPVVPTLGEKGNGGPQPGIDFKGPHYNLNLIGKTDWSGGGSYDNPKRHTIFVPENTTTPTQFYTPNGKLGITIWMTQGDEFEVIDGNGCDGEAAFQLGPDKYDVYVVAKAKPGGYTDITGWGWVYDEVTGEYYFQVGTTVNVGGHSGKPQWKDATKLFYVGTEWIFDYLASLGADDTAYFWQYDNHGNKLIQVRFYEQ